MASPTTVRPEPPQQDVTAELTLVARALRAELGAARCVVYARRPDGGLARLAADGDPRECAHTSAAVPLLVEGEVAGVLEVERPAVDGRPPDDTAAERDATAAAPYAGLAETILGRERQANVGARQRRELAELGRTRELQRRLSAAVASGTEGDALVALLASMLGTGVALLDAALHPVSWSAPEGPATLHESSFLPGTARVRTALADLGPEHSTAVLPPDPDAGLMRRHLVAALVGEGEVSGYLDVVETGRRLGPADAAVAEYAAAVLALQSLSETRRAQAVVQARDDVLGELLRGSRTPDDLRRMAAHVGLEVERPHLLVRLPVADGRSARDGRAPASAVVADAVGVPVLAIAEPDAVVLLAGLPSGSAPEARVKAQLGAVLDRLGPLTGCRRAVVSAVCRRVEDYPAAHAECRDAEAIVAGFGGRPGVLDAADFRTLRLVVNGERTSVAVRFAETLLGPLRRNDAETGGDLTDTLRHYLACGAQVRATAKVLGVHENTIRYRLGRIEHVGGLDLRRFDALLAAQLALQVDDLARGGSA
ncbi:helix-turn-helix domain-containing protein [Pseudonocardia halophobica]|uniref:Transcriptional regulator n=1 Tax=Pseudonocardia halophobica TaxID=29401 RepID=A0A9W6KYD7_9PSEU|nr:helix-turn-helix domain-containing protein [Pseudonocardia halophobica]GLL10261.1 transcriptional regulator [Pseudonocardia halophobica]